MWLWSRSVTPQALSVRETPPLLQTVLASELLLARLCRLNKGRGMHTHRWPTPAHPHCIYLPPFPRTRPKGIPETAGSTRSRHNTLEEMETHMWCVLVLTESAHSARASYLLHEDLDMCAFKSLKVETTASCSNPSTQQRPEGQHLVATMWASSIPGRARGNIDKTKDGRDMAGGTGQVGRGKVGWCWQPSWGLCCCDKIPQPEATWEGEVTWLFFLYHCPPLEEVRAGTWRQELTQRPRRSATW